MNFRDLGILRNIQEAKSKGRLLLSQLLDPDSIRSFDQLADIIGMAERAGVDYFLFGGSLITKQAGFDLVAACKKMTNIPIVLFPSSPAHIDHNADGILFLSLLSGRNPDYLIGNQVAAAPLLRDSSLEILPTAYLLIGCGRPTTAEYMSNTMPIPYEKSGIAACTALAGEMMGMKLTYLDGGSGAEKAISPEMVSAVKATTTNPLIIGGGIRNTATADALRKAGADMLVVGNAAEYHPEFILELASIRN